MARNYIRLFAHLIWATKHRSPIITAEVEEVAYRNIIAACEELNVTVLALNGVEDHVHLVVSIPTNCSIADLMKQVKGQSSYLVSELVPDAQEFTWQRGFGAISIDAANLEKVIRYVRQQKERHQTNRLWDSLEKMEDE